RRPPTRRRSTRRAERSGTWRGPPGQGCRRSQEPPRTSADQAASVAWAAVAAWAGREAVAAPVARGAHRAEASVAHRKSTGTRRRPERTGHGARTGSVAVAWVAAGQPRERES